MGKHKPYYTVDVNSCWIWQGAKYVSGYGNYKKQLAHRAFYISAIGRIEVGNQIHHICGHKLCVNPTHLLQLSNKEHQRLHGMTRTHCPNGHAYTPDNVNAGSKNKCKACHRDNTSRNAKIK